MTNSIEVKNMTFSYGEKPILNNINFTINKGEFIGIIGANGSGKSTLIKLILKILKSTCGEIKIQGISIDKYNSWNKIGYIAQKTNSFNPSFPATVEEVVMANLYSQIGLFKFPKKIHREKVFEALKKVDMQDYGKRMIGKLSGGQLQRVFIARVLVSNPEILILDEPTVGIDEKSQEMVYHLLQRLNETTNLTIIMVTHDIAAITIYANRLIYLGENGLMDHPPVTLHQHDYSNQKEKEVSRRV